ncbi:MAG: MarR family winged helix-turn-helix transcriptional regulator [Clostridium sp.]
MKDNYLGKEISELYRLGNSYITKGFLKHSIAIGQHFFLAKLYREQGITQDELTDKVLVDKATTARAIKKLEDNGYVIRVKNDNDKRVNNIFLTDKALEFEEEFWSILNDWNDKITQNLNKEEKETLFYLLGKVSESAYKYGKGGKCNE